MRLKNFLIIILSPIIVLSAICVIPSTAFAATYSGNCGENVIWSFDSSSRILTISGSGEMCDYYGTDHAPWLRMYPEVESIIIEDGVTSIGNYAFYDLYMLKSVIIPDSVTSIGDGTLDVNGDESVDNKDLTRLFQYLSNWDVEIFLSKKQGTLPSSLFLTIDLKGRNGKS